MLSNTYQMSSEYNAKAAEIDPENVLLWRMPRRRLEAEAIRDGIMSVSGGLATDRRAAVCSRTRIASMSRIPREVERSTMTDRFAPCIFPLSAAQCTMCSQAFDLPDPSSSNGDRDSTVVAPQALFMMNSSVMLKHSRKMADGLLARADLDDSARIREAYETGTDPSGHSGGSGSTPCPSFLASSESGRATRQMHGRVSVRRCWLRANSFM